MRKIIILDTRKLEESVYKHKTKEVTKEVTKVDQNSGRQGYIFQRKDEGEEKNHVYNQKRGKNTNNPTHSLNPSS